MSKSTCPLSVRPLSKTQFMVVDGKSGDKYVTYEMTPYSGRLVEKRGDWSAVRNRAAWNKAREAFVNSLAARLAA